MIPSLVYFLCPVEASARGREPDEAHVWEEQTTVQEEWRPPANTATHGGETEEPEQRERWDGEMHPAYVWPQHSDVSLFSSVKD